MFDYDQYEKECDRIRKENEEYMSLFKSDLEKSGLSPKTIDRHLSNVDFYINEYVLREEPCPMSDGVSMLDMFLGYFFIRKCMWSTPGTIKSTAASIKKFYKCMADHGIVDVSDYEI